MTTLSVSQLNRYVKSILDEDANLKDIYLKGEISNFKDHYSSGHLYFVVKDDKSAIKAMMFAGYAQHLKIFPEDGMEVLIRGNVSLYEADGSYQLYVTDMMAIGKGKQEQTLKELTQQLQKAGLFDIQHKKILPRFPQSVGVITSATGAAIEDIKNVLSRRYPIAKMLVAPAVVQGALAVDSLISAIHTLDSNCDVIIIGRGGGSSEDLAAFNSEKLAYAIFGAKTPIVSAVGHEIDTTICDLVADYRAPTPSAAAELVVPSIDEIKNHINKLSVQISSHGKSMIKNWQERLNLIGRSPVLSSPNIFFNNKKNKLANLYSILYNMQYEYFKAKKLKLVSTAFVLESLNPFSILSRGYTAVFREDKPISSVSQIKKGDTLSLKFNDGTATVTTDNIKLKG